MAASATVRIAAAQINSTVGDLAGNCARIREAADRAHEAGADILLTPELSVCGYPPEDLVLREAFIEDCSAAVDRLCRDLCRYPELDVIVGVPQRLGGRLFNAAVLIRGGVRTGLYAKHNLPEYGVFDEKRWFSAGDRPLLFSRKGVTFGLAICEDVWLPEVPAWLKQNGCEVVLAINASPYFRGKEGERLEALHANVSSRGMASVYCNLVGGQDELVFDGGSFVADAAGRVKGSLEPFAEGMLLADFEGTGWTCSQSAAPLADDEATWKALVLATRDYIEKNRFPGAILGLSGGVDSALVCALAVDALGADRVHAVMMPSRYTADMSVEDAKALASNLGVHYSVLPIAGPFAAMKETLAQEFAGKPEDVTEENLQARIRGMLLMALSNKTGSLVLTTGNKSETAVGYSTLYGDLAGGFAVIKDVPKTLVYRLCRLRNERHPDIPERILTRAPSAELREGQTDQQSLPDYAVLDEIIRLHVEQRQSAGLIAEHGFERKTVDRVIRMIQRAEFKRRQSPVGPKVSTLGFGRDWRLPITNRYKTS